MTPGAMEDGLEIMFDWAIDGGGWPGPGPGPDHCSSSVGEVWLGPLGLLDRLELELGLGACHIEPLERAVELAGLLKDREGFWSRSLEIDRLATAVRLLSDRDALRLWGWRGEPASDRLAALWSATTGARPGVPDRLDRVCAHLARRRADIAMVHVVEPIDTTPPLWRRVFAALERAGTRIVQTPLPCAPAPGDLGAARATAFTPAGDGSLQLVRPYGVLAAAEEVAAALAAYPDLRDVVVIGPDAVLDAALARHGLPRLGARVPAPGTAMLVRLCVESAFHPMDAGDLHALLCLDPGPVPRHIAWRLAAALRHVPGRGGTEWRDALTSGLHAVDDGPRDAVAARIAMLLDPVVERTMALPIDRLAPRMRALADWARARVATTPSLTQVIAMAERLVTLACLGGNQPLELAALRRLCDEIEAPQVPGPAAEAGLAAVGDPGALLGSPSVVVWWGFTRDRAPRAPRFRISSDERAALSAVGVVAPDAGFVMAQEARRWRRPLSLASRAAVLVCPRTDEMGGSTHPHPLWDELIATMPKPALEARLHTSHVILPAPGASASSRVRVEARRARAASRPVPAPSALVHVAQPLGLCDVDSASSIEVLLGCSLAYILRYRCDLAAGLSRPAARPGPLLCGNLAHHVIARVFADGALEPAAAAQRAAEVIDADLPRLAETLLLPEYDAERVALRRAIVESTRAVATWTATAKLRGVEVILEGKVGPATVTGRADLLLTDPDHVIDFKWSGASHRERLRAGAAVQLALYAALSRTGAALPGAAYLLVRSQRLLAARSSGSALPGASVPTAHTVEDMLRATQTALERRLHELSDGVVVAPSAIEHAPPSLLADGGLHVAPPCAHCEFDGLCGRRGRA